MTIINYTTTANFNNGTVNYNGIMYAPNGITTMAELLKALDEDSENCTMNFKKTKEVNVYEFEVIVYID